MRSTRPHDRGRQLPLVRAARWRGALSDRIRRMHDHGHQIAGPPREIYLNDPQSVLPEDLLTEVQFPIEAPA